MLVDLAPNELPLGIETRQPDIVTSAPVEALADEDDVAIGVDGETVGGAVFVGLIEVAAPPLLLAVRAVPDRHGVEVVAAVAEAAASDDVAARGERDAEVVEAVDSHVGPQLLPGAVEREDVDIDRIDHELVDHDDGDGVAIDGEAGRAGPPVDRLFDTGYAVAWLGDDIYVGGKIAVEGEYDNRWVGRFSGVGALVWTSSADSGMQNGAIYGIAANDAMVVAAGYEDVEVAVATQWIRAYQP